MVEIIRHQAGPRLIVAGYRIHHGAVGAALTALGMVLMVHDLHDFREWLRPKE